MRPISFARGIFDNLGVKLIALVVALVIWFNASGQQIVNRAYLVPLNFVNIPDSLTTTGPLPSEVELSVLGTRRELLFLGFRKMDMLISLARATPGRFTQRLSVSDLLLPSGIEPGDVRILSPVSVTIAIERVISKRVQVVVQVVAGPDEEFLLTQPPQPSPQWVKVTGAESAVAPLQRIPTRPLDLSRVRENQVREVEIDIDNRPVVVEPPVVAVTISLSPRATRVIAHVPPTILVDDKYVDAEIFPKTVSITVHGPQAVLDTLSSGDFSILLDLDGRKAGTYVLAPDIIMPEGVASFTVDVDSIRVLLTDATDAQSMN